jgi:ketosteroid isomerase-like protein
MRKLLRKTRNATVHAGLAAREDGARQTVRRCIRSFPRLLIGSLVAGSLALGAVGMIAVQAASAPIAADQRMVAALAAQYQEAVKNNDADTMNRTLADDFVLVTGSGKTYTRSQLLEEARRGRVHYEHQEDSDQTVRVWGDTAVVTAKLWEKGTDRGKPLDCTLWFSDTYVRTPKGWRYVFGQASLPLPNAGAR